MDLILYFFLLSDSSTLTYEKDIKPIFKQRCTQCHNDYSTLPNWMNYDIAFAKRAQIRERVWVTRTMPIGFITEEERKSIKDWIDQGAKR